MKLKEKEYYVLQNGISKYFKSLDVNKKVVISDSPFKAQLFDDKIVAMRFQRIVKKDYKKEFVIIKLTL